MRRIFLLVCFTLFLGGCNSELYSPQLGVSVEGDYAVVITLLAVINNRSGEGPRPLRLPYKAKPGYQGQKSSVRWLGVLNLKDQAMPSAIPVSWYLIDPVTGAPLSDKTYSQTLDMQEVLATPMGKQLQQGKELLIELVFRGDHFRTRLTTRDTLDPIWIN
ncbi:hypothetical protein [Amphritea balenae]|uniref:Uncharacterized protein n=1 Tax=Amphritea balenae TaxID=452629 RepID=A0A3P1SNB5_9GAMM|nr:hypothetical protein [Amphritea balenae]RRC98617.1 hypothetical protein EHS89_13480 [Amphritea balenae]GGK65974.1 hypothetical protein GCM10007941_15250 [Amphritea balenae]